MNIEKFSVPKFSEIFQRKEKAQRIAQEIAAAGELNFEYYSPGVTQSYPRDPSNYLKIKDWR